MEPLKKMSIGQARKIAKNISDQFGITNYKDWSNFINGDNLGKIICPDNSIDKIKNKNYETVRPVSSGKTFASFKEAKKIIKSLGIKNRKEWQSFFECDESHNLTNIPSNPPKHYKNDWTSWEDFLGAKHKVPKKFRPFNDAVIYVRDLCIEDCKGWQEYCDLGDRPKDIPHSPQKIYKDEWQGWNYFLGIGLYRQEFYIEIPPEELIETIKSEMEWDIADISGMVESFRDYNETDEDILEEFKEEPKLFLDALKKYLKENPREGEDE